jgi:hypothetical protein
MPQYMLMFVDDDDVWNAQPADQLKSSYADIGRWWDGLEKKGVIKSGGELDHRNTATTVRRMNGAMTVSEGPFLQSKEHVGGYALISVPDLDAAIAVAKSWPGTSTTVEVRPIVER